MAPGQKPDDCTYAQLEVVPPQELAEIFGSVVETIMGPCDLLKVLLAN